MFLFFIIIINKKKRVGNVERNFYQNVNIFQNVIRKQRSLDQKNGVDKEVCTISGKQKKLQNNNNQNQEKSHIISNNSSYLSVTPKTQKNIAQFQEMAHSVCELTNSIKNKKKLNDGISIIIDNETFSHANSNPLKVNVKNDEKKTVSEIESDNLLKGNALFKDILAEEEEFRQEAKRRGIDEDSYVFQSMNKNSKTLTNDFTKNEKFLKGSENKNIPISTDI